MKIQLPYDFFRIALLAATLSLLALSLFGVHPAFAGDPGGSGGPH